MIFQDELSVEKEVWKKVERSYQQSSREVSELLHNKLQYLTTLQLWFKTRPCNSCINSAQIGLVKAFTTLIRTLGPGQYHKMICILIHCSRFNLFHDISACTRLKRTLWLEWYRHTMIQYVSRYTFHDTICFTMDQINLYNTEKDSNSVQIWAQSIAEILGHTIPDRMLRNF